MAKYEDEDREEKEEEEEAEKAECQTYEVVAAEAFASESSPDAAKMPLSPSTTNLVGKGAVGPRRL
ncbi:hypothetical protein THARTR1_00035 [Trichoderma harzianum]|uniref:Uncharacterized protein n=1 Tax=Trichoderma harzianum TaxID=5544 RepID=A0A2K0UQF1_TRIHA|nr:hypothetical protein THARTR1_00035 [Trichoderma harzianum]